jgi:pimeloyl-ACP methyl ester carboxylesterase
VRRAAVIAILLALVPASAAAAAPPSVLDVPERTADAGQGKIGYRSVGRGRPLVMIMGLSGSIDAWQPSFVDSLARKRRVIVLDNAGVGQSTLGTVPLTIPRMADDAALLIRALRLRRADVLGWSMGGMIAQALARRHPRLVRRLVLCATAPGNGKATLPDANVLGELGSNRVFDNLFPGDEAAGRRYVEQIARYPGFAPTAPPDVTRLQFGASGLWLTGQEPSGRPLRRLRLPVLVGGGALDRVLPAANQRHLGRRLPNARLRMYPRAGHGFLFQHRRDFVGTVQRFLH